MQSKDVVDAAVCVLAAADFIRGNVVPPLDQETALIEGWIWAPPRPSGRNKYLFVGYWCHKEYLVYDVQRPLKDDYGLKELLDNDEAKSPGESTFRKFGGHFT